VRFSSALAVSAYRPLRTEVEVPDDGRARRLITMLGYAIPIASYLPVDCTAAADQRYLDELNSPADSVHGNCGRQLVATWMAVTWVG
jgi:hypothetical protein